MLFKSQQKNLLRSKYWPLICLFKVSLVFILIIILVWGFYLYSEIHKRIDGKVWQLPAVVYGRMINVEPGILYTQNNMIALLQGIQYRQVSHIKQPGEFVVKDNAIYLLRRAFDFFDSKEGQVYACMVFKKNQLIKIKNLDTGRDFALFRLDPRLITMLQSPNSEQRLFVPRSGFPDLLIDTLITTEDNHFYNHDGISLHSIIRAFLANINAGHAVQGGSTLTQQLVKNLFLSNERSLWRKAREAYMAMILDASYSKDHILELYLNEVYLGQDGKDQIRGFPLASLYYFGRPINELSIDQQAMLVGMVKGASLYNPWHNHKLALERRNLVLHLLEKHYIIDKALYTILSTRPLKVELKGGVISSQVAFMQMVRKELQLKLNNKRKNLSGMRIFTTLDPILQNAAEKAVQEGIPILKQQYGLKDLETAMVVVDRFNGEIHAIIGGANPNFAGYNRALKARRSIGSLAKPATYLTALSKPNSYRLNSLIKDEPISIKQSNGTFWKPMNEDHLFKGKVMLVDALTNSMNVPTVNLGMELGLNSVVDTWIKLGVPESEVHPIPAMLLGSINLTPIEVTQVFQSIASGGKRAELSTVRSVVDENGRVLYRSLPYSKRIEPAQVAYLTLYTMQQVVHHGTARSLGINYPNAYLAGKTGTTNNLIDSWFAGIDGKEVVITWVGRDNNQSSKLYGASGAMQIYRRYLENQTPTPLILIPPEDIIQMKVNFEGDILCTDTNNNYWRELPIWTLDPSQLCHKKENLEKEKQKNINTSGSGWIRNTSILNND
ncbi:bifunctional glycosyl transferase/transpeptidase [Pantoea sp. Aalb]|uniref:bifunctional glycosyl transferase/transpeptidase n=1 Tax=Pantoea sp. Aalb TaxID=2576762 RepID=UPI00132B315C|nr:bifunctional glycosyl transferase/transpeptidase [Pantoea sp. Aalb]MXP67209.1 bifunctional glycosyl transferase/transpeptidase [Pantoea sp. Aalb]